MNWNQEDAANMAVGERGMELTSGSWGTYTSRIEELETQLQVYMNQADDWEVKARNLEVQLSEANDDIDDLANANYRLIVEREYQPWVMRAEGLLIGLIVALILVVVL